MLGLHDTRGDGDVGRRRVGRVVVLAGELFEGLALGLGDEEGGEDTAQHEESVDLEDVVQPGAGVGGGGTSGSERSNSTLEDWLASKLDEWKKREKDNVPGR